VQRRHLLEAELQPLDHHGVGLEGDRHVDAGVRGDQVGEVAQRRLSPDHGETPLADVLGEVGGRVTEALLDHAHRRGDDLAGGGVHELRVDVDLDEFAAVDRSSEHHLGEVASEAPGGGEVELQVLDDRRGDDNAQAQSKQRGDRRVEVVTPKAPRAPRDDTPE
jgi:hypothetical protein